ncbi:MAG: hypothetical protein KatS3mg105_4581 [Gemmatales bacterium]|nr:MAG: hypothetical protein KatS3mg105_4581 [Gemmatales bacterium]
MSAIRQLAVLAICLWLAPGSVHADAAAKPMAKPDSVQPAKSSIHVHHFKEERNGWKVAESKNFRIFHRHPLETVEKVAQVAEETRARMHRKWFGDEPRDAVLKCDIYLHQDQKVYFKETGVRARGHFKFATDNGRVIVKRIDLPSNDPELLTTIVPHEATHALMYDHFGQKLPRWANEGMAMLSEPLRHRYLRYLPKDADEVFHIPLLMEMKDYPRQKDMALYYAQSYTLVDFLVRQKGPREFTRFLSDSIKTSYTKSLKDHYGWTPEEAHARWQQFAYSKK